MIKSDKQWRDAKRKIDRVAFCKKRLAPIFAAIMGADEVFPTQELDLKVQAMAQECLAYQKIRTWGIEPPDISTLDDLGNRLIQFRIHLGWSVDDMAKRLNIARSQIYRWEAMEYEQVGLGTIKEIVEVFKKGYEELLLVLEEIEALNASLNSGSDSLEMTSAGS